MKRIGSLLALALLAGCVDGRDLSNKPVTDVDLLVGPSPTSAVETPVSLALQCVASNRKRGQDLRIAVGEIVDGTGARTNGDSGSSLLTQRPDLMFIVGMFQTGIRTINRSATRVSEWELAQAMEKRLGEGRDVVVDGETYDFRPVPAGGIIGSTHYVTGALTEVNWNVNSSTTEAGFLGVAASGRTFSINLAADIVVTETQSTEIVFARSYQKTLVGREVSRGLFRFFETGGDLVSPVELFDLSVTDQQNEPVHRAVRWLMELAAYDVAATMSRVQSKCDPLLRPPAPEPEPSAAVTAGSGIIPAEATN